MTATGIATRFFFFFFFYNEINHKACRNRAFASNVKHREGKEAIINGYC